MLSRTSARARALSLSLRVPQPTRIDFLMALCISFFFLLVIFFGANKNIVSQLLFVFAFHQICMTMLLLALLTMWLIRRDHYTRIDILSF